MKKWVKRQPVIPYNKSDPVLEKLRKIYGIKDMNHFLNPVSSDYIDPYLLNNIETVSEKIVEAIKTNRKIVIFADVDHDGVCSVSLLFNYLRQFTTNLEYVYVQRDKGHGISNIKERNFEDVLLIAVDSSTSESDACEYIVNKNPGCEILVIDHHSPTQDNEFATIVNPYLSPDYPNKFLSGSATVFKVVNVLDDMLGSDTWTNFWDLAGMGLVGDQMDLRNAENRYIVHMALLNVKNEGVHYIFKKSKRDVNKLTATDVAFNFSPAINGATRMGQIELAIACLTETENKVIQKCVRELLKLNNERKIAQKALVDQALKDVNNDNKIAFLCDNNIDKNFAGLIAADIAGRLKKPTIVVNLNEKGNYYSGSYRTYGNYDVKALFESLRSVKYLGGHPGSGGVGIFSNQLDKAFKEINEALADEDFEPITYYDLEVKGSEITRDMIKDIVHFSRICGSGVPEPRLLVTDLMVLDRSLLGEQQNTVKLECDGCVVMKFRTDQTWFENECPDLFDTINVIGSCNLNEWFNFQKKVLTVTEQIFSDDIEILQGDD